MTESRMDTMTNRRITALEDLDGLAFQTADGLIPVVAQDARSGAVLMVAWASRDALEQTVEIGVVHFWSRSRGTLWKKGESSGNVLEVRSLHADCDGDTVLALVHPAGPVCHTGDRTCFGQGASVPAAERVGDPSDGIETLSRLNATLAARADERPAGSYTVKLLDDLNLRLKKLGEETAELVAALAVGDAERATDEAADLLYHTLVALRAEGIGLDAVMTALEERAG